MECMAYELRDLGEIREEVIIIASEPEGLLDHQGREGRMVLSRSKCKREHTKAWKSYPQSHVVFPEFLRRKSSRLTRRFCQVWEEFPFFFQVLYRPWTKNVLRRLPSCSQGGGWYATSRKSGEPALCSHSAASAGVFAASIVNPHTLQMFSHSGLMLKDLGSMEGFLNQREKKM